MDPWLEGHEWPDLHHELASCIKFHLIPQVTPKYSVRIDKQTVEDTSPEEEVGIMYPDVEVFRRNRGKATVYLSEPQAHYGLTTPATLTIPTYQAVEVRIPIVEIRDRDNNQLITAIEVLSPVNKRKPGIEAYREKRELLHRDGVHLMEIDLLRRGERPFKYPSLPRSAHYFVMLVRSDRHNTEVWALSVRDKLPILPVPLKAPDKDVRLDLAAVFDMAYERSRYDLSANYDTTPPPPAFNEADLNWLRQCVKKANLSLE